MTGNKEKKRYRRPVRKKEKEDLGKGKKTGEMPTNKQRRRTSIQKGRRR